MNTNAECSMPVLLIDDDEVDLMHIERELKKLNVPICFHIARNGIEAFNQLYSKSTHHVLLKPRIIVLDLMMPKMNGIEFIKEFRAHSEFDTVSVLILTTSNNEQDKRAVQDFSISGYFVKEIQFDAFIDHCKYLLEQSGSS